MPSITLNWSAPTSGGTPTSYNIYRGTSADGESSTAIATVSGSVLTYTDTTTNPGGVYYYKVSATNAEGTSAQSNEASAMAGQAPGVPQDLTAVGNS